MRANIAGLTRRRRSGVDAKKGSMLIERQAHQRAGQPMLDDMSVRRFVPDTQRESIRAVNLILPIKSPAAVRPPAPPISASMSVRSDYSGSTQRPPEPPKLGPNPYPQPGPNVPPHPR